MPPIRGVDVDDGIIEVSSSPPRFVPHSTKKREKRVTRASSRAGSLEPVASGSGSVAKSNGVTGKGKKKSEPYKLGPVIELTDSEDESIIVVKKDKGKGKAKESSKRPINDGIMPVASSSKTRPVNVLNALPIGPASGTALINGNQAGAHRRTKKTAKKLTGREMGVPLFLKSDDEGDDEGGEELGGSEEDEADRQRDIDEDRGVDQGDGFIDPDDGLGGIDHNPFDLMDPFEIQPQPATKVNGVHPHSHVSMPMDVDADDEMDEDMRMAIALSLEEDERRKAVVVRVNEGMGEGVNGVGRATDKGKGKEDTRKKNAVGDAQDVDAGPVHPLHPQTNSGVEASGSGSAGLHIGRATQELPPARPDPVAEPVPVPDIETAPSVPDILPIPVPSSPRTTALIHILEIIPNIQPEYAQGLVEEQIAKQVAQLADVESQERERAADEGVAAANPAHQADIDGIQVAQHLVGVLLEEGGWPKVERGKGKGQAGPAGNGAGAGDKGKGKRKSDAAGLDLDFREGGSGDKKAKVDWASKERVWQGGDGYIELALIHLQSSFPLIPKAHLRRQLQLNNSHYAPTHISLRTTEDEFERSNDPLKRRGYNPKATVYHPNKDLLKARRQGWQDAVLEEERKWVEEWEVERNSGNDGAGGTGKGKEKEVDVDGGQIQDDEDEEESTNGEGIECQCCFAEYSFAKMVQCPEAHLFCNGCVSSYASTQLGSHNASILCMHSSGCAQPFPVSELRRILTPKLMELYDRVKQQKEIEQAGLEDLEECPFCEFKCVIDRPFEEEKLFRCGNEDGGCGVVSCRNCKKEDHLPKSCEEMEEDKHLDGQHAVEEAMTRALMRNCPKCKKPFIKDQGCNKMSCPNCHTLSCYVCRQIIQGYEHFDQRAANQPGPSRSSGKCLLWDSVDQRHADEVKAAAEKAMAQLKESHPDADADKIKIDLPKAPPPPPPQPLGMGVGMAFGRAMPPPVYAGANMNNAFNVGAFGGGGVQGLFGGLPYVPPVLAPVPFLPPVVPAGRARRGRQPRPAPLPPPVPPPAPAHAHVHAPMAPLPRRRGRAAAVPAIPAPAPPQLPAPAQPRNGYAGLYAHDQPAPVLNMNLNLNQARAAEGWEGVNGLVDAQPGLVGGGMNRGVGVAQAGAARLPDINAMLEDFVANHPQQHYVPRAQQLQNMMRWRRIAGLGIQLPQQPHNNEIEHWRRDNDYPNGGVQAPRVHQPDMGQLDHWLINRPEQHHLPREMQAQNFIRWDAIDQRRRQLEQMQQQMRMEMPLQRFGQHQAQ